MFETTINSTAMKEMILAQTSLVQEAIWKVTPEGISIKAVDPANVAMVSVDMPKTAFTRYEAGEHDLGINLDKIKGIMDLAEKDSLMSISLMEKEHRLKIKTGMTEWVLSLLDPSSIRKGPKIPALDLPVEIGILRDDFKRGLKAAGKVSDYVSFGTKKDIFYITGDGDTDKVCLELNREQLQEPMQLEDGINALYSLDYLNDISKPTTQSQNMVIRFGKDFPVKLEHKIAEGQGNVMYMLAPRVDSN